MSGRFRRDFLYFFPLMKKTAVVFLLFFAAGSLRYSWFDADVSAFDGRSGESAELTGRIVSEEVREDRRVFEIRVRNEDGSGGERILVTVKNPFFERKERSQTENKPEKGSGENASPGQNGGREAGGTYGRGRRRDPYRLSRCGARGSERTGVFWKSGDF